MSDCKLEALQGWLILLVLTSRRAAGTPPDVSGLRAVISAIGWS